MKKLLFAVFCFSLVAVACHPQRSSGADTGAVPEREESFVAPAVIPADIVARINENRAEFIPALEAVISADAQGELILVDKQHFLDQSFIPAGLVPVSSGRSYVPGRAGLSLTPRAEAALEEMSAAARLDGVTLVVSSTYRSYDYQAQVYARNVKQMGQAAADRESAKPGASQHQLGTAVDFGSITDEYADTAAGKWLAANAARFGWSLSFPRGYEPVTGYRWECWHYRYVGKDAAALQNAWFGGVQQYMIVFIDAWKNRAAAR